MAQMEVRPSVCPLDCPDRCSLDVTVDGGRVVKIDGSDRFPFTAGFICAKVRRFDRRVASPERLLHPLKRVGPKGSRRYERIGWDEAVGTIAARFSEIARTLGPEAILPYHYDGSNGLLTSGSMDARFWNRLGASRLARTFCAANTGAAWEAVLGDLPSADQADVEHSDAIVLWGVNPSASGIHLVPLVRKARAAGAFLAVVDPRRTPLAREADLHLPVEPGADVPLALAMIRAADEEGLVDRAFIEKHARGWPELRAACGRPEDAAALCGVDARLIRELPRALARGRRPFFRVGWGLERNRNGTDAVRAVLSLRAVLGRFGARGSGVALGTSKGYFMNRTAAEAPHLRKGDARTINMSEVGRVLDEAKDPPVAAVYVYNCNPAATAPHQSRVLRALSRESLFVVVHEQLWTDTCDAADIVLPATTFLEHTDLCRSYGGYALQWSDPVIAPAGEARSNHAVFSALAKALGFSEPEFRDSEEDIARTLVDVGRLKETRFQAVPRPIQFVDAFPSRGYVDLAAKPGPPIHRPPPVDADLPLVLISPASEKAVTSQLFEQVPEGTATVTVSPAEAARRGLKAGDTVRLRNSFGEVVARLAVSDEVRAGVASMPKGLWRRHTKNGWTANALAPDHVDPIGGGACYNDARVEMTRA
jgi:anaerobic selenocysteine-containing dehydrogenase